MYVQILRTYIQIVDINCTYWCGLDPESPCLEANIHEFAPITRTILFFYLDIITATPYMHTDTHNFLTHANIA